MTKDEEARRFLNVTVAGKAANDSDSQDEENAKMIFGPDWRAVIIESTRLDIDWKTHVNTLVARLRSMENTIELDTGEFQRALEPAWWPVVALALEVGEVFENERRALLGLMDTGSLSGQLQVRLSEMFNTLNDRVHTYIECSLSYMLGELVGKMSKDEVDRWVLAPYNHIVQQRRAIFDMLGEAAMMYGQRLYIAMQEDADKAQEPPPVH